MNSIKTKEIILQEVGFWNLDIDSGWRAGMLGKERFLGKLRERQAPDHLYEPQNQARLADWLIGRNKAKQFREAKLCREVRFSAQGDQGQVSGKYKGWSINRAEITTRLMMQQGCYGDVIFDYYEGGLIVRSIRCGI